MVKSYIVNLDLYASKPVQTEIFYTAGDQNAYPLELRLTERGRAYPLPSDAVIEMNLQTKANTLTVLGNVTNPDHGIALCQIGASDIPTAGPVVATVSALADGARLTWAGFTFTVLASSAGSVPPETERPWFSQIMDRIDEISESGAGTSVDLSEETSARIAGDAAATESIYNEETRAKTAENALQTAINEENERAQHAEAALSGNVTDYINDVAELATEISQESARAQNAESGLREALDALSGTAAAIEAETERAEAAEAAKANIIKGEPPIEWRWSDIAPDNRLIIAAGRRLRFDTSKSPVPGGTEFSQFVAMDASSDALFGWYEDISGRVVIGQFRIESDYVDVDAAYDSAAGGWRNGGVYELQRELNAGTMQSVVGDTLAGFNMDTDVSVISEPDADLSDVRDALSGALAAEATRATTAEAAALQSAKGYADAVTAALSGGLKTPVALELESQLPTDFQEMGDYYVISNMDITSPGKQGRAWWNSEVSDTDWQKVVDEIAAPDETTIVTNDSGELAVADELLADISNIANLQTVTSELSDWKNSHDSDEVRHITAAEREAWNGVEANTDAILDEIERATEAESSLNTLITTANQSIADEATRAAEAEAGLSEEISDIRDAGSANASAITDEAERATAAEGVLQTAIGTETQARIDGDTGIMTALGAESSRAQSAESGLNILITTANQSISAETTRAAGVESNLQGEIDAETVRAATAEATLTGNLNTEISARQSGDAAGAQSILDEETRAKAAEGVLQTAVSDESAARQAADSANTGAIVNETARAAGAESTLQGAISAEASRATGAELALAGNIATATAAIGTETTRAANAESGLSGNIAANAQSVLDEETRAKAAEAQKLDKAFITGTGGGHRLVKDVSFAIDGDAVTATQYYVDPADGSEMNASQVMPLASGDSAGLMPKESFSALGQLVGDVGALKTEGGKFIGVSFHTKDDLDGYSIPETANVNDFTFVENDETRDGATTRYIIVDEGDGLAFAFAYVLESGLFAEGLAGRIVGAADEGKVFAESDGTGSVVGFDALKTSVANEASAREAGDAATLAAAKEYAMTAPGTVLYTGVSDTVTDLFGDVGQFAVTGNDRSVMYKTSTTDLEAITDVSSWAGRYIDQGVNTVDCADGPANGSHWWLKDDGQFCLCWYEGVGWALWQNFEPPTWGTTDMCSKEAQPSDYSVPPSLTSLDSWVMGDYSTTNGVSFIVPSWKTVGYLNAEKPDDDGIAVITGSGVYDAGDFTITVNTQSTNCNVRYARGVAANEQRVYSIGNDSTHVYQTSGAGSGFDIFATSGANNIDMLISVDAETGKKTALTLGLYFPGGGNSYLSIIRR